jgi:hypothetical protein
MINRLQIVRYYTKEQTEGDIYVFGEDNGIEWTCKSLELKWLDNKSRISCIPEGEYTVVVRYSKKYSRHLHITDVEGRSYILIHWGNYAGSKNPRTGKSDIQGCVMTGNKLVDINNDGILDVVASKKTFKEMMEFFPDDDQKIDLLITAKNDYPTD